MLLHTLVASLVLGVSASTSSLGWTNTILGRNLTNTNEANTAPKATATTKPSNSTLCVGARNSTAQLVDCEAPGAAHVWGSHRHLAVAGGCLKVATKSNKTGNISSVAVNFTTNSTATVASTSTTTDGTVVILGPCDPDSLAQKWGRFSTEEGVEFRWTPGFPSKAGTLCLDVTEGTFSDGTQFAGLGMPG
ncbi:hypothetical protein CspeluHIS016_0902010 [Cutaneotrichosporon spelunceum]|uniref:Ricin B lectin domain-containing protein n=1 Tax=Cutaneotrichosporon spelunceum TaxID=1672016 RepID=A0AAD3TZY6_9TREE|nr:hypothetical protein CspeluHIS016_0902010 [Cutaneotrichosporon spelunceum]